jgi:hypothetical protein
MKVLLFRSAMKIVGHADKIGRGVTDLATPLGRSQRWPSIYSMLE